MEERIAGKWGCVTFPSTPRVNFGNRKIYFFFGNQSRPYDMTATPAIPATLSSLAGGAGGAPVGRRPDAAVAYKGKAYLLRGFAVCPLRHRGSDRADPSS